MSKTVMMIAGTPSFMAPEQATHPDQTDARSDLYSLGMVAYYMLTGQIPFKGQSPIQIMMAQIHDDPDPPSTHQPGIPADLEAVVLQCLEKDPDKRLPNARELRQALLQCDCARDWSLENANTWWADQRASQRASQPAKIETENTTPGFSKLR
jgi:serine/threonine-protein kinase